MQHLSRDVWWEFNILSKFQVLSSYGLGEFMFLQFRGKNHYVNEFLNYKPICRTDLALPGLSIVEFSLESRSHLLAPPAPEILEVALFGPFAHPIPQPVPEPHPARVPGDGGLGGLGPQVLALRHRNCYEGLWNQFSIKNALPNISNLSQ